MRVYSYKLSPRPDTFFHCFPRRNENTNPTDPKNKNVGTPFRLILPGHLVATWALPWAPGGRQRLPSFPNREGKDSRAWRENTRFHSPWDRERSPSLAILLSDTDHNENVGQGLGGAAGTERFQAPLEKGRPGAVLMSSHLWKELSHHTLSYQGQHEKQRAGWSTSYETKAVTQRHGQRSGHRQRGL